LVVDDKAMIYDLQHLQGFVLPMQTVVQEQTDQSTIAEAQIVKGLLYSRHSKCNVTKQSILDSVDAALEDPLIRQHSACVSQKR
jgi:hypothetical protein